MDWHITPLGPLGARVEGVNLGLPLTPAEVSRVEQLMDTYAVLVFPDQSLDQHQQIAEDNRESEKPEKKRHAEE